MGRTPCCEKMGMKRGPWTPQEDLILINHIRVHGHSNWRALPKQAGLLRCGKSCRLRWINYLRPDIKRGNFTKEEEETIIKLHEMLGNRWSAIASRLPGRTDNEIKNVWHTHLKKRLPTATATTTVNRRARPAAKTARGSPKESESNPVTRDETDALSVPISSPHVSDSDVSTVTTGESSSSNSLGEKLNYENLEDLPAINEDFWAEVDGENCALESGISGSNLEFWFNIFTRSGALPELPEVL